MTERPWLGLPLAGLLLGALVSAGGSDLPAVSKHIIQVEPRVWLAGALDMDGLRYWDPTSTVIIDLRTEDEGIAQQRIEVQALGMDYYNVPVAGATLVDADLLRVGTLLRERSADSVILHCASGNRAGMVWGALQVDDGQDLATVLDAVSGVVTKNSITQALRNRAAVDAARTGSEQPATPSLTSP